MRQHKSWVLFVPRGEQPQPHPMCVLSMEKNRCRVVAVAANSATVYIRVSGDAARGGGAQTHAPCTRTMRTKATTKNHSPKS